MKNVREIGYRIRSLMEERKLSVEDLANNLEKPADEVNMALFGRRFFSFPQLEKISDFLNVPVDRFFEHGQNISLGDSVDCMNRFTDKENCEEVLDLIYDYLDVYDSIKSKSFQ